MTIQFYTNLDVSMKYTAQVFFSFSFLMICSLIRLGMLLVRLRNDFMDVSRLAGWLMQCSAVPDS
jgi:hypothetical protein